MRVILAESAGFCYGVRRAVELARETAEKSGGCWMLGDLIHNSHVIDELKHLGVQRVKSIDALQPGDTVLIRSHGESKQILERLQAMGICCVDATCPNVRRIQTLAAQAEAEGRTPVIIGDAAHPEVAGIASWCRHPLVFSGPEAVEAWLNSGPEARETPLTVMAQTTCIRELFETSWKIVKKECTNAKKFDTICTATHKRQSEAAILAAKVDVMVVVGDRKSANTKHLTEICKESCRRAVQIENADELSPDFFSGCSVAGLTAGASTPAGIIK
ncbi:MAG: 4-hydroxy-3-methylbut-2-enyl diphosphate reductase, partial [Oscillibacter sp.]|nr:4-hydroxy-3-methylbut-2-enyl diphosphate reductase [Oscillibacter sp.]